MKRAVVMVLSAVIAVSNLSTVPALAATEKNYTIDSCDWDDGGNKLTATWDETEDSTKFKVMLYRAGTAGGTKKSVGSTSTASGFTHDFSSAVIKKGTGWYSFVVYPVKDPKEVVESPEYHVDSEILQALKDGAAGKVTDVGTTVAAGADGGRTDMATQTIVAPVDGQEAVKTEAAPKEAPAPANTEAAETQKAEAEPVKAVSAQSNVIVADNSQNVSAAEVKEDVVIHDGAQTGGDHTDLSLLEGTMKDAAGWKRDDKADGSAEWRYLRADGGLARGWANIEGSYYFFDQDNVMLTGWQWIRGYDGIVRCYWLGNDGKCLIGPATAPDGSAVNGDGAWVVNGVVQTK